MVAQRTVARMRGMVVAVREMSMVQARVAETSMEVDAVRMREGMEEMVARTAEVKREVMEEAMIRMVGVARKRDMEGTMTPLVEAARRVDMNIR